MKSCKGKAFQAAMGAQEEVDCCEQSYCPWVAAVNAGGAFKVNVRGRRCHGDAVPITVIT